MRTLAIICIVLLASCQSEQKKYISRSNEIIDSFLTISVKTQFRLESLKKSYPESARAIKKDDKGGYFDYAYITYLEGKGDTVQANKILELNDLLHWLRSTSSEFVSLNGKITDQAKKDALMGRYAALVLAMESEKYK